MSKLNIIPVFVPHYGCPNDCIFCNQRKITNKNYADDLIKTRLDIEEYLTFFSNKNKETQIAFYGGSFTGLKEDVMVEYLKLANYFIDKKLVNSVRLSTRPDYIDDNILEILKFFNVKTIELGVQSLDDDVLYYNNRGHNSNVVFEAAKKIKEYGFELGLQQMVGLYKDDFEKSLDTARKFVEIGPKFVRIYPTLVIKDTELERLFLKGVYKPLSIYEAINIIKPIYIMYTLNKIDVIRIGLQPTDNINEGKDVIAGPFHAAFRQLVLQEIFKEILSKELDIFKDSSEVSIFTNKKNISYVVGNNGENKKYYSSEFKIKKLKFIGTDDNYNNIIIKTNNKKTNIDIYNYYKKYLQSLEV
ncbi:elongator complex protein 3 [Miniphocaeibacter halophilus]|uniref:Radical SAM protein n=1 Tax=Miniphocaeibacter halophilus TaxID=2931922 RepID=A0AC61MSG5_9FIRM|nr:radical SAM protein [Miniphocaeibacter halophilus]QQK07545.1 radical SAM protein [Miniphocaeibacter halophilus]